MDPQRPVVFVVSDSVGETAEFVARAAAAQFDGAEIEIRRFGGVRDAQQVEAIVAQAAQQPALIVYTLILPEVRECMRQACARRGILAGMILGGARALGEFGATLMISGNIPGKTQTIPLAIYSTSQSGDMAGASVLVLVMIAISFGSIFGLNIWKKRTVRWQ